MAMALSILTPSFAHATCTRENIVRAGAVADATSGDILSSHGNIDERFHPASLTKIVSTLVVLEAIRNDQMSLTQNIIVAPSQDGYNGDKLSAGRTLTLENALRASSASQNGIYISLARAYPGGETAFVNRMNGISRLAGAENTNFINPNGLFLFNVSQNCAQHYTTIRDLFRILHYAQREYPNEMRQYFGQSRIEYDESDPNISSLPRLNPTSALLADRDAIAARENIFIEDLKTGYVRYSGAHIMGSARINGHFVYGIETGVAQGVSPENRWYRLRDTTLLNAFRQVRNEFTPASLVANYQQQTPLSPYITSSVRINFSGVYPYLATQTPSPTSPHSARDNFLPVSLRPPQPTLLPTQQTADILPVTDPAPVTLNM
jgi:D-alanyl-D-alanine carboxypeptidase